MLLLAMAACLACSASAALPAQAFANPGGPPFLNGPSYHWNASTSSVVTMGITFEGNYSFAYTESGALLTELGIYTSWECGKEPGSYLALLDLTVVNADGDVLDQSTVCEYGFVYSDMLRNTWAQSADECPSEVTEVNRFLGERPADNTCGTPSPDYTLDQGEGQGDSLADQLLDELDAAPTPAPGGRRRLLMK